MKGFKKSLFALVLVITMLISQTAVFADTKLPTRAEAEEKYKWNLSEIYATRADFEADMKKVEKELLPKFEKYKGKLSNAKDLLAFYELDTEVGKTLFKGYVFANMSLDLDQTNTDAQEMADIAGAVYSQYQQAVSFEKPEILAIPADKLKKLMNDPKLAVYKHHLDQLLKQKEHTLSEKEEALLSSMSELLGAPEDIFNRVLYGDYEYPTIKDKDGKEIKLTNSAYYKILEGSDRELRRKAFEARTESYKKINNTLAGTYTAEIKKNIFSAKARGYNSSIEAALAAEFIPKSIYTNLVDSVNKNLKYLHKYYAVKKKALGLDALHAYDDSVPLVEDYNMEIGYEDGVALILKGLEPLGKEYLSDFQKGIDSRWVDVYEDDNKYTGAYSWGSYTTHPYILMNYSNDLDSTLTLAHEMGHALNSFYSDRKQHYYNADYPIFTAEVASTANELLVMDYLIKNAKSDEEKLFLLDKQIENIKGTIYTQVMFSEFEKTVHEMAEAGQPLSPKAFNQLWLELIKKYYGDAFTVDEASQYNWGRIPHFYMNFYVYKYATAMSASYALVNNIVEGKDGATDKFLEFLAAGGSDYPVETLKKAGVDMTSSEPVDEILAYFGELVDQMEQLLNKRAETKKK